MSISNVVLDRDRQIVTFDTDKLLEMSRSIIWMEGTGWRARESCNYETIINEYLSGMHHAGVSPIPLVRHHFEEPKPVQVKQEPTPDYYNKTFKGVKLDPYRVCKIYDMNGGPREHITKKMLRGINKDDGINTELDLIKVVEGQLTRWKEMIKEDAE